MGEKVSSTAHFIIGEQPFNKQIDLKCKFYNIIEWAFSCFRKSLNREDDTNLNAVNLKDR